MLKQFLPALGWSVVILVMSILPGKKLPKVGWNFFVHLDKIAHAIVYFLLALAIGWSLRKQGQIGLRGALGVVMVCTVYGILLELLQYHFLSDRFFEIHDIIANIIGSFVGASVVFLMLNKNKAT